MRVVVMGVSGSGKSAVGDALASALDVPFLEGDELHAPASIAKLRAGRALVDDDRWPWLDAVGSWLARRPAAVASCSALKLAYRDHLRAAAGDAFFVHLAGDYDLLRRRVEARTGHFMPPQLLRSQFEELEPLGPQEPGVTLAVDGTIAETVEAAARAVRLG